MDLNKRILHLLKQECMLTDKAQVQEYIMNRKEQIIKTHIENVFPIKEPGERGGHKKYYMTKLSPKNKNHCHPIYGKTREELEERIIAHVLNIKATSDITLEDTLMLAVDKNSKTGIRTIQRFRKRLSTLRTVTISQLSESTIKEALNLLIHQKEKISQKEFNQTITCLNKIADYCAYNHISICDIKEIVRIWKALNLQAKHIFKPKQRKSKDLTFNRSEASKIIRYALNNPSYLSLAVALMITTGLRIGELLALTLADIFIKDGFLWIYKTEDTTTYEIYDYTKTNTAREVFLSDEAIIIVKELIKLRKSDNNDSEYLFLHNGQKMHRHNVDYYLRSTIHYDVLKLSDEDVKRSCHDCRRTYATLEYLNGTMIGVIKSQLGHSSIKQTEEYIQDVIETYERRTKINGCGLILDYTQCIRNELNEKEA